MASAKPNVFLDASVFIAAILSSSGGSFHILNKFRDDFEFETNSYVLREVEHVLDRKFAGRDDLRNKLYLLLGLTPVRIVLDPPIETVSPMASLIHLDDAPVLTSALANSSFLLTLDHDFLTDTVIAFSQRNGLQILKPKEFIERHRA